MKYSASKNDFFVTRSILETHNHLDMFFHVFNDITIYLFVKQFIINRYANRAMIIPNDF